MSISSEDYQQICHQIQHHLSLYLDGMLIADHEAELLAHLEGCSPCSRRLTLLRQVQSVVQQSDSTEGIPDFTQAVMQQFQQDIQIPLPCEYDYEFISAYMDNALSWDIQDSLLLSQRIENFEKHLPACNTCAVHLGQMLDLKCCLSRYQSHLEEALDLDLTEKVMQRFLAQEAAQGEEDEPLPMAGCGVFSYEDFSAFVDKACSVELSGQMQQHCQHCTPCQHVLDGFTGLNQAVTQYGKALEAAHYELDGVSLWHRIEPLLNQDNVIPIQSKAKKVSWLPLVTSGAVAAVFLVFMTVKMSSIDSVYMAKNAAEPAPVEESQIASSDALTPEAFPVSESPASPVIEEQWTSGNFQASAESSIRPSQTRLGSPKREAVKLVTVAYITPEEYLFAEQTEVLRGDALEKGMNADYIVFADY